MNPWKRRDTQAWRASNAYTSPRKIYPRVRQPHPTQAETTALARMQTGDANPIDYENTKFLIRHCAAYGCAFVREKGARGQAACPGWCQLTWKYEAEVARTHKAWPAKERIKPRPLSHRETRAFQELTRGQVTSENLLVAEGVIRACKADGCAHVIGSATETQSGICLCPGWCKIRDEALERKWVGEGTLVKKRVGEDALEEGVLTENTASNEAGSKAGNPASKTGSRASKTGNPASEATS